MLGDIAAILGGSSKRRKANDGDKRLEDNTNESRLSRYSSRDQDDRESKSQSRDTRDRESDEDDRKARRKSRRDDDYSDYHNNHRRSHRHEKEKERHHDRDRDRDRNRDRDRRSSSRGEREREREEQHRRRKARSSREKDDSRTSRHRDSEKADTSTSKDTGRLSKDDDSDSDPLDDIIGPALPSKSTVRRRGRGVNSAMSGIDNRFAADYDPKIDVTPDPDETGGDDWDTAVETFRDRMKWKQQGAERLRSAGFTEEQIRKWEKGGEKGGEKDETDVKWDKAGGVREWDRGKLVSPDGAVTPQPEYGRLKGT